MKERAKTLWMGNGFGIEFVVGDPWTIFLHLILEKDPTLSEHNVKTIASNDVHRKSEYEGSEEPMRHFAERSRLEALEWAEIEIAEYKKTEDLVTIMCDVLEANE